MTNSQKTNIGSASISLMPVADIQKDFKNGKLVFERNIPVSHGSSHLTLYSIEMPQIAVTIKAFNYYFKKFDKAWTKLSKM